MKERKNDWDFVKAVLMLIVIYGHVCPASGGPEYAERWNAVARVTGLFVMPLYFFVSGYFQSVVVDLASLAAKYRRSLLRIGLPLVAWGLIYVAGNVVLLYGDADWSEPSTRSEVMAFLKYTPWYFIRFFWFLSALLLCVLVGSLLSWLLSCQRRLGLLLLALSSVGGTLLPVELCHFTFVWFFYACGMVYRQSESGCTASGRGLWPVLVALLLSFVVVWAGYGFMPDQTFYGVSNLLKDTSPLFLLGRYALCLLASVLALYWLKRLYGACRGSRLAEWLAATGRDTLFLYCSHVLLMRFAYTPLVQTLTDGRGLLPDHRLLTYYVVCPVLSVVLYVLLLRVCTFCKRWLLVRRLFLGTS